MIDKRKLSRRFSRQAKTYDKYARVQKEMAEELLALCKTQPKHILEIGSGTGYLTQALAAAFPNAKIHAIDIAEGMIDLARDQVPSQKVTFECGDFEDLNFNRTYDLVISNATFQWFNHLEESLRKIKSLLEPQGCLIFSTFGHKTFHELHSTYQALDPHTRPGQSFYSLEQLKALVIKEFPGLHGHEETYVETFETCMDFFQSIKKIGANRSSRDQGARDPDFIHQVMTYYENNFTVQNQVQATYQGLFITAHLT